MHSLIIGIDLAKSIFQIHGIDGRGPVVIRKSGDAVNRGTR